MEKTNNTIDRGTVIKIIQALLCTAYVVFMSVQAVSIYTAGVAANAADPRVTIYTQATAANAVLKGLPLLIAAVVITVIGAAMMPIAFLVKFLLLIVMSS